MSDQKNSTSMEYHITYDSLSHTHLLQSLPRGKYLIDVDGNKYTDYWMGHWSLILGHAAPKIAEKVKNQVNNCWMHGTVNENTIEFSEVIKRQFQLQKKFVMFPQALKLPCMQQELQGQRLEKK